MSQFGFFVVHVSVVGADSLPAVICRQATSVILNFYIKTSKRCFYVSNCASEQDVIRSGDKIRWSVNVKAAADFSCYAGSVSKSAHGVDLKN
jgi:hypothetical protein